eukprot:350352-Chlamydomonas_euryale.AAC.2
MADEPFTRTAAVAYVGSHIFAEAANRPGHENAPRRPPASGTLTAAASAPQRVHRRLPGRHLRLRRRRRLLLLHRPVAAATDSPGLLRGVAAGLRSGAGAKSGAPVQTTATSALKKPSARRKTSTLQSRLM